MEFAKESNGTLYMVNFSLWNICFKYFDLLKFGKILVVKTVYSIKKV